MPKVIWLLDYDGCSDAIFNEMTPGVTRPTYEAKKPNQFSSDPLAGEIQKDIEKRNTVSIGIGSNRYSTERDQDLAKDKGNGPCHANLKALAGELGCEFEPLMLADPYNQKKPGYAFSHPDEALESPPPIELKDLENKVSSLYMQLHHAASTRQGNETITVNFVDDLGDILNQLKDFFTEHPDFIPEGIKLNLFQYTPYEKAKDVNLYYSFDTGTGPIDSNYLNTTRYLLKCVDDPTADLRRTSLAVRLGRSAGKEEAKPFSDIRPHIINLMRVQEADPFEGIAPDAIAEAITIQEKRVKQSAET